MSDFDDDFADTVEALVGFEDRTGLTRLLGVGAPAVPGAKYDPKRGLGRERHRVDQIRPEPAWTIAGPARPAVDPGLDSPGCIYNLPSAIDRQIVDYGGPNGAKPSAPRPSFTEHSRWAQFEKELRENTVPGPGAYG